MIGSDDDLSVMENLTGNKSYVKVTVEGQIKEGKEKIAEEKVESTEVKPEVELKIEEKVE